MKSCGKKLLGLFIFISFVILYTLIFSSPAKAASNWQKYSINPVVNIGLQNWKSFHVWSPYVMKINGIYKMWYVGYDGQYWRIGNSSSNDGINWTDNINNPVIDNSLLNENVTEPTLSFDNGIYKMWYVSVNKQNNQSVIKYVISNDGIHWSTSTTVLNRNQAWEINYLAHPEIVILNNNYRIFYSGDSSNTNWSIGSATSIDGINWSKNENNPILNPSPNESPTVGGSSVIYEAGKYIMYYHSNHPPRKFNYATSTDGINWNRGLDNPIMTTNPAGFDRYMIAGPSVIRDGNLYKMWYSGHDGSRWRIGYATASAEVNSDLNDLNVPLIKQISDPWQSETYDTATNWNPSNPTINRWGCALTSAAMVLKYYGINKIDENTDLDPGTLNDWLNNEPDGYVGTGWINWLAVSRLSSLSTEVNNITDFDALEYSRVSGTDSAKLKQSLKNNINNSIPGILSEPGHFIVAKGINNDTFNINDPYYDSGTLNDGYDNTFLNFGKYSKSNTDLSYIMLVADKDIKISVFDSSNKQVGEEFLQQPIIDPVTGSENGDPIKMYYLPKPETGEYKIIISSNNYQTYNLGIYLYDISGNVNKIEQDGITGPNNSEIILINFDKQNSHNSGTVRSVTFQTTLDDIKELQTLGLIHPAVSGNLNSIIKNSKSFFEKGNKKQSFLLLNAFESLINATRGKGINEKAYQILLYDIQYLKTHL